MRFLTLLLVFVIGCISDSDGQDNTLSVHVVREDFQFLRDRILEIHPNPYLHQSGEEEQALYASLLNKLSKPLDAPSFYKIVAEYTTSFRDGHTFPSMNFAAGQFRKSLEASNTLLPVEMDFKEGFFFIADIYAPTEKTLRGARVLSVNRIPSDEIISAFQHYYSKKASLIDNAHVRMFREYFWLAFGSFQEWEITYQGDEGESDTVVLDGLSLSEFRGQRNVARQGRQSMEPAYSFTYVKDEVEMGLLTMNRMGDMEAFEIFAEKTFKELSEKKTPYLVIDMRQNGGGNSALGNELYAYLSSRPYNEGRMYVKISDPIKKWYVEEREGHPLYDFVVQNESGTLVLYPDTLMTQPRSVRYPYKGASFLLTSSKTYSSGHMFAGLFKCNNIGPVIGQETGQATKTVGDAFTFQLPHSKIDISVSYKVFESSCEPSYSRGFLPDHNLEYTSKDLVSGIDKEMQLVRTLINAGN